MTRKVLSGVIIPLLFLFPPVYGEEKSESKEPQNSVEQFIEVKGEEIEDRHRLTIEENFSKSFTVEKIFAEDLQAECVTDVKSALKGLPNVTVTDNGAFSKDVSIRGLGGERIITQVDGIKISNQGMSRSGGGESNLVDTGTIDTIEVVKGSPSVMYDPGASGGMLRIITKKAEEGTFGNLKHSFLYDDGYEKTRNSTTVSAGYEKGITALSLIGTISETEAEKYNLKNRDTLDLLIHNTNQDDYRTGTAYEIKNLGFEDEAESFKLRLDLAEKNHFQFSASDYSADNITFTVPALDSRILVTDRLERETRTFSWLGDNFDSGLRANLAGSAQTIRKGSFSSGTMYWTDLESEVLTAFLDIPVSNYTITTGGEITRDEADTLVVSDQDYHAFFLNGSAEFEKISLSAGLRWNHWETQHKLPAGMDEELALLLNDVSGWIPNPIDDDAFTYAAGGIFHLNEKNNISLNYSRTYRAPTLYERFAYDSLTGGGTGLKPESADNMEMAWKYMSKNSALTISCFHSRFKDFMGTKTIAVVKREATQEDRDHFAECVNNPDCTDEEWESAFDDLYNTRVIYANLGEVDNTGFEISYNTLLMQVWEFEVSTGLTDFNADNVFAEQESRPLEFNGSIKKYFLVPLEPWIKLHARSVTGWPDVDEEGDIEPFEPFTVFNCYTGGKYQFRYGEISLNGGVRNITDKLYNEPYTVLNGLKRTFFVNMNATLKF